MSRKERIARWLYRPIDAAGPAAFRVLFGLVMCTAMVRALASGWVPLFYGEPEFHFKYWGLSWIEAAPLWAMYLLYGVLAALALLVAIGLFYRASILLFTLGFTYAELIDVTNYLNHYYLASLLGALMFVLPLHRSFSLDARRRPSIRSETFPAWGLYLLRFQVGVVYVFAGLAKVNADWLLHAQPLNLWLTARDEIAVIGPLLGEPWVAYAASWAGALFDLTIVAWLSWRKSRPFAYAAVLGFHFLTGLLFPIGMFPFIMVIAAMVFFDPSWPRRLLRGGGPAIRQPGPAVAITRRRQAGLAIAGAFCLLQVALPLRHFAYPGDVLWNEDGMRWSWKVLVREKKGSVTYYVRFPASGKELQVSPRRYLTRRQSWEMAGQPDLILQLAHEIERDFEARGLGPVEVRAEALVSLNGRRPRLLVDPQRDLTEIPSSLAPSEWVLPGPREAPVLLGANR